MLAKGANPNLQIKLLPPLRERGKDRGCDSMLEHRRDAADPGRENVRRARR